MALPLFPLLLFLTAIASIVVFQKTQNDIFAVLGVASTIACLIWGLVIAHWSIHILTLLILFKFSTPIMHLVVQEQE